MEDKLRGDEQIRRSHIRRVSTLSDYLIRMQLSKSLVHALCVRLRGTDRGVVWERG